jgi:hypothetical protein
VLQVSRQRLLQRYERRVGTRSLKRYYSKHISSIRVHRRTDSPPLSDLYPCAPLPPSGESVLMKYEALRTGNTDGVLTCCNSAYPPT